MGICCCPSFLLRRFHQINFPLPSIPRHRGQTTLSQKKIIPRGNKRHQSVYSEMWRPRWTKGRNLEFGILQQRSKPTVVNGIRQSIKNSILCDADLQSLIPHSQIYKPCEQYTACVSKFLPLLSVYNFIGDSWLVGRNGRLDDSGNQVKDLFLPLCFFIPQP